jgi:dihydrofolate reductase
MSAAGPLVSLIVAVALNGVIGREGATPWHLPDDLKRFKALTMGKPMLMGRKTFESIGRPLLGRTSLVLTRSREWARPGAVIVRSMGEAIETAKPAAELVVIGGGEVYTTALPYVRRIYLTRVLASVSGDTLFAPLEQDQWRESRSEEHPADARNGYATTFSVLERVADLDPPGAA